MLQKRAMPRSSTLGDHHTGNHTRRDVVSMTRGDTVSVTIHDSEQNETRNDLVTRILTVGTCILLIGSGIGVGIWAAM